MITPLLAATGHVHHVVHFWPFVKISTPVSVMLITNELFRSSCSHFLYIQECIFELSAALAINGRSSPIIRPMNITPIVPEVDHLGKEIFNSSKWLADNILVLS